MGGGVIAASLALEWISPLIRNALPPIIGKLYGVSLIPWLWMFLVAAFVAEYREKILPFLKRYWWVFFLLLIAKKYVLHLDIPMNHDYALFGVLLIFASVLGFAYKYPNVNIKTDISYGIYIYHMTVINALMVLGFTGQRWTLWAVVGLSCLLAYISTITIGRLSMNKKKRL